LPEGLRKTMKIFSLHIKSPGIDLYHTKYITTNMKEECYPLDWNPNLPDPPENNPTQLTLEK
jgi:hypothetical protein